MTDYPELEETIEYLRSELTAAMLFHFIERGSKEPWVYTVGAKDNDNYINSGVVGWNPEDKVMYFFCLDPAIARHDELEGISEDDSVCWFDAKTKEMFLYHLIGKVRKVQAKFRKFLQDREKEDSA